tara:strand:+ start:3827 stop:5155 length:1329 start_codon:yes stop_codon:yes gene_type:complete
MKIVKPSKKGQKLWKEAKSVIPGGNQLLSKRPEMFLPNIWPSYYKKAKGCEVWDLDDNKYFDFATMGIGACALGFADSFVNQRVKKAINSGSMSTLNSFEEVKLAKKLIDLHPWADKARFSRSGGEACSIAVRIARAFTKKDKILFCGYHGWHDWYLSSNFKNKKNLDKQLLSGLSTDGVAKGLEDTAYPFSYNDKKMLKDLVKIHRGNIAAIFMEPIRNKAPTDNFLQFVRDLASEEGIVLIFDEITSGFRKSVGGIHKNFGVNPDLAVFGKALGNGFPISAIIGKNQIMEAAQKTFISSTFWTERIGYVAALATIEKYEKNNVVDHLQKMGDSVNKIWTEASSTFEIEIEIDGIEPLTHINFKGKDPSYLQTLYTQEMLKKGFLTGANVYTSYSYNNSIIKKFKKATLESFDSLRKAIDSNYSRTFLDNEIKHSGFKRLN